MSPEFRAIVRMRESTPGGSYDYSKYPMLFKEARKDVLENGAAYIREIDSLYFDYTYNKVVFSSMILTYLA